MKKTKVDDFFTGTLTTLALSVIPAIALANAVYALFDLGGVFGAILFYALAISAFLYLALGLIYIALFFKNNPKPKTYMATDNLVCVQDVNNGVWSPAGPRLETDIVVGTIKKGDRFVLRRLDEKAHGAFKFALFDKNGKPVAFFVSKKSVSAKSKYGRPLFETLRKNTRRLKRLERERYDKLAVGFPKEGKK